MYAARGHVTGDACSQKKFDSPTRPTVHSSPSPSPAVTASTQSTTPAPNSPRDSWLLYSRGFRWLGFIGACAGSNAHPRLWALSSSLRSFVYNCPSCCDFFGEMQTHHHSLRCCHHLSCGDHFALWSLCTTSGFRSWRRRCVSFREVKWQRNSRFLWRSLFVKKKWTQQITLGR